MLVENTLFGIRNKVDISIERIKFAYLISKKQQLGAVYVCFSGGKDSVVIAELVRLSGVPFELHYNMTGIDPPEVIDFMKKNYKDLIWHPYEKSMFQLIIEKRFPPLRQKRYCCSELKERGGQGRMCVTGVRWAESTRRKNNRKPFERFTMGNVREKMLFNDNDEDRKQFETCQMKGKFVINPIIDWTESDVWEFIKTNKLPYCKLYDEGFSRIGCIGCPMATQRLREKEFARWPGFKKAYIATFDKMLNNMTDKSKVTWNSGEDVFKWWMYGNPEKDENNLNFFEEL